MLYSRDILRPDLLCSSKPPGPNCFANLCQQCWVVFVFAVVQDIFDHNKKTEICNFGELSPLGLWIYLQWIFVVFSLQVLCWDRGRLLQDWESPNPPKVLGECWEEGLLGAVPVLCLLVLTKPSSQLIYAKVVWEWVFEMCLGSCMPICAWRATLSGVSSPTTRSSGHLQAWMWWDPHVVGILVTGPSRALWLSLAKSRLHGRVIPLHAKGLPNRTLSFSNSFGNFCSVIAEPICFWN